MKKIILSLLSCLLSFSLFISCGDKKSYDIAMIMDTKNVTDGGFMSGTWDGIFKYSEEHSKTSKYYSNPIKEEDKFLDSIKSAVNSGAKVIVCAGFTFETAIYKAQTLYPDVKFILLDGTPHNEDSSDSSINENTYSILYAEEQAGFLAGYAAVKDGYRKLGFMGGITLPPVIRFGYGYIQGADYAAKELNIDDVEINYTYSGTFAPSNEVEDIASKMYKSGTEVIFSCASNAVDSVIVEAEKLNKKVIGVDIDQSDLSETVITSAVKELAVSVYDTLDLFYNDKFPGGTVGTLNTSHKGVALSMNNSRFSNFTQSDYDKIYKELASGNIELYDNTISDDASKVPVSKIKVHTKDYEHTLTR